MYLKDYLVPEDIYYLNISNLGNQKEETKKKIKKLKNCIDENLKNNFFDLILCSPPSCPNPNIDILKNQNEYNIIKTFEKCIYEEVNFHFDNIEIYLNIKQKKKYITQNNSLFYIYECEKQISNFDSFQQCLVNFENNFKGIFRTNKELILKTELKNGKYKIQSMKNIISFLRQFIVIHSLKNILIYQSLIGYKGVDSIYIKSDKEDIFLSNIKNSIYYNNSQKKAIELCSNLNRNDILLIHGPPGTGKTYTLIGIVSLLILRNKNLLICAPSNEAVDVIYEYLNKGIVNENLEKINCSIYRFKGKYKKYQENEFEKLQNSQIILSTLNSAADNYILNLEKQFTVLIDESAQTDILTTFIPLLLSVDNLIMFGDHKQLSAAVFTEFGKKCKFNISFFERCMGFDHSKIKKIMLDEQYRMNINLGICISSLFYERKLKNSKYVEDYYKNPIYRIIEYKYSFGFIQVKGQCEFEYNTKSYYNESQIKFINGFITNFKNIKNLIY